MKSVGRVILTIIGIAFFVALMRVFNWDPFGVLDWAWSWIKYIVMGIADWLAGNGWFQKATRKPSLIVLTIFTRLC